MELATETTISKQDRVVKGKPFRDYHREYMRSWRARGEAPSSTSQYQRQYRESRGDGLRSLKRQHYHNNKSTYRKRAVNAGKERRKFVWEVKMGNLCIDCGENDPRVLDFDHVVGVKKFAISTNRNVGMDTLVAEMQKCEIRCSNCHRRKTFSERQWGW